MPEWLKSLVQIDPVSAVIAVAALVTSVIALRRQNAQWREGGPLAACAIHPGAMYPGGLIVGVPSALVADALPPDSVSPVVVLTVSGTGRLPIYLSSVRFETTHRFRDREWRWWKPWRRGHRLIWLGNPVAGGGIDDKIDAVQRKDLAFPWGPIKAIAEMATQASGPAKVRAVVVLGNGTAIRTAPLDMSSPPQGPLSKLTSDGQPPPASP